MVFRKQVGEKFIEMVRESRAAPLLGRKGRALMSGEDSLLARAAYRLGYACSYQPALKMSHCMKARRMRARVLAGTMLGHGRSYVVLQRVLGESLETISVTAAIVQLARRLRFRAQAEGMRAGLVRWFWDLGYFYQLLREIRPALRATEDRREEIADIYRHS
jgi:hypothetical protein